MALDMESEFYKLAKDILGKPQNLYKLASIGPKSGRLSLMGADGYVVVGRTVMNHIMRMPPEKAFLLGRSTGEDTYGSLVKEFDEEVQNLGPRKLLELGALLAVDLGYGNFTVMSVDAKAATAMIKGARTMEMKYRKAEHHMLTCGLLAGISSISFKRPMEGKVDRIEEDGVTFSFGPAAEAAGR